MRAFWIPLVVVAVAALSACSSSEPSVVGLPPAATSSASPIETPAAATPPVVVDDPAAYGLDEGMADSGMGSGADWEGVHFVSPSRNEGCVILGPSSPEAGLWGCALASQDWEFSYTDPDGYCFESEVPCGYGIEATGDQAPHPRRRGDPGFPAAMAIFDATGTRPVVATLPFGHSISYGAVTCDSTESGVTCSHSASGHGFAVSKNGYELH